MYIYMVDFYGFDKICMQSLLGKKKSKFCYSFRASSFLLRETTSSQTLLVKKVMHVKVLRHTSWEPGTGCWIKLHACMHVSPAGALAFDKDYAGWEDEHRKQISELRAALNAHAGDDELRRIVDGVMAHHHEAFRLKCVAARADAFHVLSGMWKTPVERCFMWLGGFRPSEILKVVYG